MILSVLCQHYVVSQEGNLTRSDHDSGISGAALIISLAMREWGGVVGGRKGGL